MATLNPNSDPFKPLERIIYYFPPPPPPPFLPYGVRHFLLYFPKPTFYPTYYYPQQLAPLNPTIMLQTTPKVENPNPPPCPKRRVVERICVKKELVGNKEGFSCNRVLQSCLRDANTATEPFEFGFGQNTTLMIKNIPNKYPKEMLLEFLDLHCRHSNSNGLGETGVDQPITLSEFDFFYLPIDFRNGNNFGYAFVNFTSPVAAWRLYRDLHNKGLWHPGSRKICEITYAHIQGLDALKKHFENSVFFCHTDAYLPEIFSPCRNGSNSGSVRRSSIGRRITPRNYYL